MAPYWSSDRRQNVKNITAAAPSAVSKSFMIGTRIDDVLAVLSPAALVIFKKNIALHVLLFFIIKIQETSTLSYLLMGKGRSWMI